MALSPASNGLLPASPTGFLQGYNSITGAGLSTALIGTKSNVEASGFARCYVATSSRTLLETLEISEDSAAGFGSIAKGSHKLALAKTLNLTAHSVHVAVRAVRVLGGDAATGVELKDGVLPPDNEPDLREFVAVYGDRFVSEIKIGGEYFAVYSFQSEDRQTQMSVVGQLAAAGIVNGVSLSTEIEAKFSKSIREIDVARTFAQSVVGLREYTLPGDEKEIVDFARTFGEKDVNGPDVIALRFAGYEQVPGLTKAFAPVATNRDKLTGSLGEPGVVDMLLDARERLTEIQAVSRVYKMHRGTIPDALSECAKAAEKDVEELISLGRAYLSDPHEDLQIPERTSVGRSRPRLHYKVVNAPLFGSPGGAQFDDVESPRTFLLAGTRLAAIQFRGGGYVDRISVTYERADGSSYIREHGGEGGTLLPRYSIAEEQVVRSISGRSGDYVDSIEVRLSDETMISAGGPGGALAFDWTVPEDAVVLGFRGNAGEVVDRIGLVCVRLLDPTWAEE
ncbi:jacalin-like lectin [Sphingosinicella sp. BN140058]|uniref:jacalin-like lectin n=1 Tax=Sphingosinicella sp. BN140058 TaxID=1892855 RepID=UPI001010B0E5|nr:hypothetical protein [Sphingosinicella sp. BN140058]QAY80452.1 hypothetical protein ETR14_27830 [Sphingosinicella sp. BN140058]